MPNVCGCTDDGMACNGKNCGMVPNNCGAMVTCAPNACNGTGQSCGGGGMPNVCGCTPDATCNGSVCGTTTDNCGNPCTCSNATPNCFGNSCAGCANTLGMDFGQRCNERVPICTGGVCGACTSDTQCVNSGWGATCSNGVCKCIVDSDCLGVRVNHCVNGFCACGNTGAPCPESGTFTCTNGRCL
jgi:hypothetical protein